MPDIEYKTVQRVITVKMVIALDGDTIIAVGNNEFDAKKQVNKYLYDKQQKEQKHKRQMMPRK